MKYLFLLAFFTTSVFAQAPTGVTDTITDEAVESKKTKPSSLPQNSEQEKQQEEAQEFLGPYDREGNYKVQIKKQDDTETSD